MLPGTTTFAERTRSLLRQVLAMGQNRLEMLGLAVEKELHALGRELRLAAVCIIAAWLSGTSLVLFIAVATPRQVGLWILGALCLLFGVISLITWQILKGATRRERLFSELAEQLRQDAKALESLTGINERD
jgi:hypothetical protein